MTDHLVRLYALVVAVLAFFVTWALVAAQPWKAGVPEPASTVEWSRLDVLEQRLGRDAVLVEQLTETQATAPIPRLVTAPAITQTRTS